MKTATPAETVVTTVIGSETVAHAGTGAKMTGRGGQTVILTKTDDAAEIATTLAGSHRRAHRNHASPRRISPTSSPSSSDRAG